ALFCNAHCFMVGVPGLAKTLMVSTLSQVLGLSFKRIQFTPDLMPSDITGTDIIQEDPDTGRRSFEFFKGPIFANLILADEINRTPPKTQASMLEAMQERQVTVGNKTLKLEQPFFILATQNPIEQEGTYPLPEAQLDRFMLNIFINYPSEEEELEILKSTTVSRETDLKPVLTAEEIIELQSIVKRVPVGEHVFQYALELVRKTRPEEKSAPEFVKEWLDVGAGPRAGQNLILGAKARALMEGRFYATTDDVAFLALPVLRHRIITNFNAESEGISHDAIIENLLKEVKPQTESK
ncbi:MAG: MoxR family ATPase, partial [Lentisphaeria bacterium]|nr:MoxR family ATPase [Lentisphaeria bacterium]NQZ68255.1 MoxR family ATPase [Lentisphaeria bacterium]